MLCLVRFKETEFTRTIESFAPAIPILVAEFDSSLSGAGLIWFVRTDGAEVVRGVSAVNLAFLGFGTDSSNQNLAEYIDRTGDPGFFRDRNSPEGRQRHGPDLDDDGETQRSQSDKCVDDLDAALHSCGRRRQGGCSYRRRGQQTMWSFISSVGYRKDPLITVLEEAEDLGLRDVEVVEMDMDPSVRGIVHLCDPRDELNSESQFISFWIRARDAIDMFMSRHNHTRPRLSDNRGGPP
jgi:hypothetical protein